MDLGQRLKNARLECGLSQRQLCGDVITRNMLSQIESGKAKPSMDTLRYLATQLGKPMGYFLEEQAVLSPNQSRMAQARDFYQQGQYRQVLAVLDGYQPGDIFDGEKELLENLCLLEQAKIALQEGRKPYARELLRKLQVGFYRLPGLAQQRDLLLIQAGEDAPIPSADEILLIKSRQAFEKEDFSLCEKLLEAVECKDENWHLLRGQTAVALGRFAEAIDYLLVAEKTYPKQTVCLLEQCYKETEDYKKAYEYACKRAEG